MKKKYLAISIILGFGVFIGIAILTNLFSSADLPTQISGALLEAVVTALITYFLLTGQTSQEEVKERNVRVFEEKSEKFNIFIDKLWDIWEDRVVTLEELNELIKIVSKDIVLYSKPETVDKILSCLLIIADAANPNNSTKDPEATKRIQKNIFDIINELAKEIGLGGEINKKIENQLDQLENKVLPYLIEKDLKKSFICSFKETINQLGDDLDITDIRYENKYLWCQLKKSNVYIRIGRLERQTDTEPCFIAVYVEFYGNRNFEKYREASRGWKKDYLKGMFENIPTDEMINFENTELIKENFSSFITENNRENKLAMKVIQLYRNWNIDGKNLDKIIEECIQK